MLDSFKDFVDDVMPENVKGFHKRIKFNSPLPLNTEVMAEHEITVNGVSHKRFTGLIIRIEERRSLPIKKYFYQIQPLNLEIRNKLDAPLWVKDSHVHKIADETYY